MLGVARTSLAHPSSECPNTKLDQLGPGDWGLKPQLRGTPRSVAGTMIKAIIVAANRACECEAGPSWPH